MLTEIVLCFIWCFQYTTAKNATLPPNLDNRIVGGVETDITSYPYQLSLEYLGNHICGAALISPTWAITAAHCTDKLRVSYLTIRAGSSYVGVGGQVVKVKNKFEHSNFNKINIDYDVALLKLENPISNYYGKTVKLPSKESRIVAGAKAVVTGWGTTTEQGNIARKLRAVQVPIVRQEKCKQLYGSSTITNRMFCAGFLKGEKDACQGDSGGPLVNNGVLWGVVSWGYGCARPGYPGIYTNVLAVREFIRNISGV